MLQNISIQSKRLWNSLCLGNISKYFAAKKKARLNGYVYDFSVNYNTIDPSNIINIPKYLMNKRDIK